MWLAALPPRNGPTTALGGMRGPVPMGQLRPQTPPPVPQLPPEGDQGCAEGGGCSLQIGAGFGWSELRVSLQVVCLYRGGKGGP